jgi:phosphate-selective porin OprO/OprP
MARRREGRWRAAGWRALAVVALLAGSADAQEPQPPKEPASGEESLRHELEELRARQRVLERRLGAAEKAAADAKAATDAQHAVEARRANEARVAADAKAASEAAPPDEDSTPRFHFGHGGFSFGTADRRNELRLRLVLHLDGRAYFGDVNPIPDTFLVRRARPYIEGTIFGLIDYRLLTDFSQGLPQLLDAYVELHPWTWLRLRAGRYRVPIGLEWLQSDSTIALLERSLATDLVPQRDIGVMLSGDIAGGTFSYQLGIFNGAPDSGNGPDFDPQSSKDYVGRVFFHPLLPTHREAVAHLGLGVAGSYGTMTGAAASSLPTYKSVGQQVIFNYIPGGTTTAAAGAAVATAAVLPGHDRWRVSPQFYWYVGPVGLLAEYVLSSQSVQRMDVNARIEARAWNVTASFVLTLEHASFEGVIPRRPVDFRHPRFGALEVVVRYSELRIDNAAFPNFADPNVSVRQARELAGGLNWYLTDHVRMMFSYHRTDYLGGAPLAGNREPENALLGRLQLTL